VLFLPWLAGSMAPAASSTMRGGFINLTLNTGRTHLVRAAVEGTAFNAGWLLPAVEALTGRAMSSVVLAGGAARSAGWAQVFADVLDRPVRPVVDPDTAVARAVALVAMTGPAAAADDPDGVVARTSTTLHPDPVHRATYDASQRRFIAAFEALRPLADELGT
jgi:xylulokinase